MNIIPALPISIHSLTLFVIAFFIIVSRLSYVESVKPTSSQPRIGGIYLQTVLNQERGGFYDASYPRS